MLYIFLCWRTKLKAKRFWGSHAQPHRFSVPRFQGCTQSVQHFGKGYTSLLKQSELTSLLIQHNQSPDTSIFTLHPNSGSKVRRERGRREREKERSVREHSALAMGHRKTQEKQWKEWQGADGTAKGLCAWALCEELLSIVPPALLDSLAYPTSAESTKPWTSRLKQPRYTRVISKERRLISKWSRRGEDGGVGIVGGCECHRRNSQGKQLWHKRVWKGGTVAWAQPLLLTEVRKLTYLGNPV